VQKDPDSPRTRRMLEDYEKFPLPEMPGDEVAKEQLFVHVRKDDAPTEPDYH
jgi:hypothetical protein